MRVFSLIFYPICATEYLKIIMPGLWGCETPLKMGIVEQMQGNNTALSVMTFSIFMAPFAFAIHHGIIERAASLNGRFSKLPLASSLGCVPELAVGADAVDFPFGCSSPGGGARHLSGTNLVGPNVGWNTM
jgi:hypothetical protein